MKEFEGLEGFKWQPCNLLRNLTQKVCSSCNCMEYGICHHCSMEEANCCCEVQALLRKPRGFPT